MAYFASAQQIVCPHCIKDEAVLAGHGAAPDGSGRRIVNVYITSACDTSPGVTDTKIFNGVQDAVNKWNNATDNSGNKTGYYFRIYQSGGTSQADITL